MVWHELFGVLALVVTGAIVISAIQPGTETGTVIGTSATGFSRIIATMKGNQFSA